MSRRKFGLDMDVLSDASIEAFQTLVLLKKEVIAALHDEYSYAEREHETISYFNSVCHVDPEATNRQRSSGQSDVSSKPDTTKSQDGDSHASYTRKLSLLKWQSPEFQKLEMRWRSQLNRSVECITQQLEQEKRGSVSTTEVEGIYESIFQLQNAYFKAVEEREKSNKLWLRLKMYAASRKDMLEKYCKPYGLLKGVMRGEDDVVRAAEISEPYPARGASKQFQPTDAFDPRGPLSTVEVLPPEMIAPSTPYANDQGLPHQMQGDAQMDFDNSTISEFLNQLSSITKFYAMTRNIYIQYGDGNMSYKVFNNIIDFLLRSLGIPSIDKVAVKKLLKAYDIGMGATINFNTFVMLYWEIAHIIRNALDVVQSINAKGIHSHNIMRQRQEQNTFVEIEDILIFKKKLSSGEVCTKYLAMEVSTGKMRVVDMITKSLRTPPFEQISMEVSRLSKLQSQHLALYLAVYHDLNTIYVVSEYCEYGSLLNHMQIKRDTIFTMGFVHLVMAQLIEAILYIHCNNIVHGSLSIDKIMIPDTEYNQVKIRDLGMKGLFDADMNGSTLTQMHMAPEGNDGRLCHQSDIWSAGVILAFLVTGIMPEERMSYSEYVRAVEKGVMSGRIFPRDDELLDIIRRMINSDASSRPTAFEIITHPWYTRTVKEEVKGNFRLMIQPLNRLMKYKRMQLDVIRVLESQDAFFVSKIKRLRQTVQLLKKLRDERLLVNDLKLVLQQEGLSMQMINNILVVVAFDEQEVRSEDLLNALSQWKNGEIACLWNTFKNRVVDEDFCMGRTEFARFLSDVHSRLLSREEIPRVCNALAVNDNVYWADFVRYFD
ncbi:mitogen-activated kinase kinase kinase like protein [Babesia gibsoni]|uniref:Mitogen-activated kinase kinase kinase like protein n=1 Tax=Babesia gibsoni TaxID=33632 RepID=A0AAD8LQH9_BABGI|nr:mitogen-activated kinase kinase kinase like protein [Babesia gibsoni]